MIPPFRHLCNTYPAAVDAIAPQKRNTMSSPLPVSGNDCKIFRKRRVSPSGDTEDEALKVEEEIMDVHESLNFALWCMVFGGMFSWFGGNRQSFIAWFSLIVAASFLCLCVLSVITCLAVLPYPLKINITSIGLILQLLISSFAAITNFQFYFQSCRQGPRCLHAHLAEWRAVVIEEKIPRSSRLNKLIVISCIATELLSATLLYFWVGYSTVVTPKQLSLLNPYLKNHPALLQLYEKVMNYIAMVILHLISTPSIVLFSLTMSWIYIFRQYNLRLHGTEDLARHLSATRLSFERLLNLLNGMNRFIAPIIGIYLSAFIGEACLVVYYLKIEQCGQRTLLYIYLANVFVNVLLVSATCASLSSQIHEGLDDLHKLSFQDLSAADQFELASFQARLSGPSLGFSFFHLFSMDKASILTLVGTTVTYVAVLYQMPTDERTCFGRPIPPGTLASSLPANVTGRFG